MYDPLHIRFDQSDARHSSFECLGINVRSELDLVQFVKANVSFSSLKQGADGWVAGVWKDRSGAILGVAANLEGGDLRATPAFLPGADTACEKGAAAVSVLISNLVMDAEDSSVVSGKWLTNEGDDLAAFTAEMVEWQQLIEAGVEGTHSGVFTLLASHVETATWGDDSNHQFLPVGMFAENSTPGSPRYSSNCEVSGRVQYLDELTNEATGATFFVAQTQVMPSSEATIWVAWPSTLTPELSDKASASVSAAGSVPFSIRAHGQLKLSLPELHR